MDKYWKQWDMVRHQMYTMASTVPSKKKLPRLKKWFPLPIDKDSGIDSSKATEMFARLKEKIKSDGTKRIRS